MQGFLATGSIANPSTILQPSFKHSDPKARKTPCDFFFSAGDKVRSPSAAYDRGNLKPGQILLASSI